tara:strand:- start:1707 stop:2363 length:657 start_codon:yes stop_codon:yes gene_type:complete
LTYTYVKTNPIPTLVRTITGDGRFYKTPDGLLFPSITSLISKHIPEQVQIWRDSVGDKVADYVMRKAANRGTKVHALVEKRLSNQPVGGVQEHGILPVGLYKIMEPALQKIDNIRALETPIFSSTLQVAGTVDLVCDYEGYTSIVDFKTSTKIRDKSEITNALLQTTFYAHAWEEWSQDKIQKLVIVMASEDGSLRVFYENPFTYMDKLKKLVSDYYG